MLPEHLQYMQETINVSKLIRTKITNKVDHISFEIFPMDGDITAFFMDKNNNESMPSQQCGKTNFAKILFNLDFSKKNNKKIDIIMNKIVKELQKSGANKLNIKSFAMVHDTSKEYKVS